jgi:hypothetical protein
MSHAILAPSTGPKTFRPAKAACPERQYQDFLPPSGPSWQSQASIRPHVIYRQGEESQKMRAILARPEYAHLQGYARKTDPGANVLTASIGEFKFAGIKPLGEAVAHVSRSRTGLRDAIRLEALLVDWLVKRIQWVPKALALLRTGWVPQRARRPPSACFIPTLARFNPSRTHDGPTQDTGSPPHDEVNRVPELADQAVPQDDFDQPSDDPLGALAAANQWREDDAGVPPEQSCMLDEYGNCLWIQ